jgi:peptidyl-prolyl cis-trans isomerase SurA
VDEFLARLAQGGVSEATFRDFVRAGVAWRAVVRGRFGPRAQVTEAEIDRALALTSRRGGAEALISEIILPARTPEEAAQSEELALQLSQTVSGFAAFSAAAAEYSVSPSRDQGGRVPQAIPLANLPPALAQQLLTLAPGEVSDPVPIQNAVAVFQLRELRETGLPEPDNVSLEYAIYLIPGGRSPEALAEAQRIANGIDTCADLYGVNLGQAPERLTIETRAVADVPADIALELARLDEGEISTALTRGANLALLMLCARTEILEEEADRGAIRRRLVDQRLAAYAEGYLAELRAVAIIREP